MYEKKVLGLAEAELAIRAIIDEASKDPSLPAVVAVADGKGDLIALARMDGCSTMSSEMAITKAYTSAMMTRDTRKYLVSRPQFPWTAYQPLFPNTTVIPGGVVISEPGVEQRLGMVAYGGIGVAGRLPDEDERLALVGLKALQDFLWPSP